MVVEVLFWFHPLVWWIERRLVEERERACDEEVLRVVNEPEAYAEGILKVCRFYREARPAFTSGVTGSNLKKRVEEIMSNRAALDLSLGRTVLVAVVTAAALAGPIAFGVIHATPGREPAATTPVTQTDSDGSLAFEVASIRPSRPLPPGGRGAAGTPWAGCTGGPSQVDPQRFVATNKTLYHLITLAYAVPGTGCGIYSSNDLISGGEGWVRSEQFDVEAIIPEDSATYTRQDLESGNAPELQAMLRTLLAERFQFAVRHEAREISGYALTSGTDGPRVEGEWIGEPKPPFEPPQEWQGVGVEAMTPGVLFLFGRNASMASLAGTLQSLTGTNRLVVDRTGLAGEFNFDLSEFASFIYDYDGAPSPPSVFSALEQQLGLRMEETRVLVDTLAIENAERPSEN
jgi:uncharacterized protein (TIGR03435 family)